MGKGYKRKKATADMDAITVENLQKKYKNETALFDINLTVKKGEIFGLLGPNGAGKTTTIGCITQLVNPTKGEIKVHGHDIKQEYVEAKKLIGLSPQELQFDPYFTLLETLVYQAGYFGIPSKIATKRARKYLKEFDLLHKQNEKNRKLSGGMKRKVSIIKALMHNPEILILDEPTAGLDVDSRYELWKFIQKINKENKITVIITTHYIEEVEQLSHRTCIINKGRVIKLEPTEKIIDDLSQNVITFETNATKKPKLSIDKYEFDKGKINIQCNKKDQNKIMQQVFEELKDKKIEINNFNVKQDNLENIFRRLVNDKWKIHNILHSI